MGLFDFVKSIGEKVFGGGDDPATKIREHLESRALGLTDLKVEFQEDDGKVFLAGQAPSPESKEKAVLLAGNVKGVAEVFAEKLMAPDQKAKSNTMSSNLGIPFQKLPKPT